MTTEQDTLPDYVEEAIARYRTAVVALEVAENLSAMGMPTNVALRVARADKRLAELRAAIRTYAKQGGT